MAQAFDLVRHLNAAASRTGAIDSILQFENLATQAQYRVPYIVTTRHVTGGDRVLDWGCGNGHFSLFLQSLGAEVTGYSFERPPRAVEGSAAFTFFSGSSADPRSLPFPNACFDAAVGVGVLEHVWETGGDEAASLAELVRVVKPGGVILTFHLPSETGWIENAVRTLGLNKHLHGRRYRAERIRQLWTAAGLRIVDMGVYNALPRAELTLLPAPVRHSEAFARAYDFADDLISRAVPRICTNYFVVGRTPS